MVITDNASQVGAHLRVLRRARRMSIRRAAYKMGIRPETLAWVELNQHSPTLRTITTVLSFYGLRLTLDGEPVNLDSIGALLQRARWEAGLTIVQVSSLAGISTAAVGDIENRHILPKLSTLARIAAAYGLSMEIGR